MQPGWNDQTEWLETDRLGGFSCGTVGGIRTRRYHGLLSVATQPPTSRFMLVNGLEVTLETYSGTHALSAHRYEGQVVYPDGYKNIESFDADPWPRWKYRLADGLVIDHQIFVRQDSPVVALSWKSSVRMPKLMLNVRPLLSGRDIHSLHRENANFNFEAHQTSGGCVRWRGYPTVPGVIAYFNGRYKHDPHWYRNFHYQEEWLRGFDAVEDLASPGVLTFDLSAASGGEAVLILAAHGEHPANVPEPSSAVACLRSLRAAEEQRRLAFASRLHRSADQYLVRRGGGKSIIAGYPWFADWGRDTFIAIRGICLATGNLDDARQILTAWSSHVSQGMLPNRFPDAGEPPEYNSVDAALWYVIAVFAYFRAAHENNEFVPQNTEKTLLAAVKAILTKYSEGSRYGIALDQDGLLRSGAPGVQLTWMDAKVQDRVITPRTGKAVEIQALWLNALHASAEYWPRGKDLFTLGRRSFREKFWNEQAGGLFDVVDVDHQAGVNDASFRPNQIFAVGGLPVNLLDPARARSVVDAVEQRLWTPLGLRSLAPDQIGYSGCYTGGPSQRDAVYHQGPVWPWLAGAFVEAWVRVRGSTPDSKALARRRFLQPLMHHLDHAGIGHVSEIADGDAPHMPRGCPFQAWSVAELLRLDQDVLRTDHAEPLGVRLHPSRGQTPANTTEYETVLG